MKPYLIILYLLLTVIIGASGDALFDTGDKLWGHGFKALEVALLISGMALSQLERKHLLVFLISYICLRIGFFDYTWGFVSGEGLLYIGSTSIWDKVVTMVLPMGMIFIRLLFTCLGIGLAIRYLKN